MRVVGVLLCLAAAVAADSLAFKAWMQEHHKAYPTAAEHARREAVFAANMADIARLNAEGGATFAMNQFGDMDAAEFARTVLMPRRPAPAVPADQLTWAPRIAIPDQFDWRTQNMVTPVRDQGTVGTCWAFSTVGAVESQRAIAGHGLEWLSVEQVVDCDNTTNPDNLNMDCGVFGGWPYLAFQYIQRTGGLMSDASYDYCSGSGKCYPCPEPGWNSTRCGPPVEYCLKNESCAARFQPVDIVANSRVASYIAIPADEVQMQTQLVARGPLSVLIDASGLQFYHSGVWAPKFCSKKDTDHAVLAVGYGSTGTTDYWIIKNSWGTKWGDQGYFMLDRGHNTCAINTGATVPLLG